MVDYSNQVMKLGTLLFELLSEALSLNSTYLRDTSCDVGQFAFGHYYPSYLEPNLTLGTIKHVDVNFITVLLQGHIGGLQVLHQNTQIDVTPVPGALSSIHPSSRTYGPIMELLSEDNPAKYREFSIPEFTAHY
ncbi:1-aminocyclopropane-1-carboxylate oxidase 9 [Glycine max]|nr:1-aminocyclopropane-1-carboxylate oxidase 9 [Glycine max]